MSAPNLKEIEWAISELEGQESSKSGYILLAALYTCRDHMLGQPLGQPEPQPVVYSEAVAPLNEFLDEYGDSEFLQSVAGKDQAEAWQVMDELMDALFVVNRNVYDSVIRKLNRL